MSTSSHSLPRTLAPFSSDSRNTQEYLLLNPKKRPALPPDPLKTRLLPVLEPPFSFLSRCSSFDTTVPVHHRYLHYSCTYLKPLKSFCLSHLNQYLVYNLTLFLPSEGTTCRGPDQGRERGLGVRGRKRTGVKLPLSTCSTVKTH